MNVNRSGNDNHGRNTRTASQDPGKKEQSGRPKKPVRNKHEVVTAPATPGSDNK